MSTLHRSISVVAEIIITVVELSKFVILIDYSTSTMRSLLLFVPAVDVLVAAEVVVFVRVLKVRGDLDQVTVLLLFVLVIQVLF